MSLLAPCTFISPLSNPLTKAAVNSHLIGGKTEVRSPAGIPKVIHSVSQLFNKCLLSARHCSSSKQDHVLA